MAGSSDKLRIALEAERGYAVPPVADPEVWESRSDELLDFLEELINNSDPTRPKSLVERVRRPFGHSREGGVDSFTLVFPETADGIVYGLHAAVNWLSEDERRQRYRDRAAAEERMSRASFGGYSGASPNITYQVGSRSFTFGPLDGYAIDRLVTAHQAVNSDLTEPPYAIVRDGETRGVLRGPDLRNAALTIAHCLAPENFPRPDFSQAG